MFAKLRCLESGPHQARRKIKDLGFSRSRVCVLGGIETPPTAGVAGGQTQEALTREEGTLGRTQEASA